MIYDEETVTEIQLYKGKYYNKKRTKTNGRVIAFDMDETMGSFTDLEILWNKHKHKCIDQNIIEKFNPKYWIKN